MTNADLVAGGAAIVLAGSGLAIAGIAMTRMVGDRAIAWLGVLAAAGAATRAIANRTAAMPVGSGLALDGAMTFFAALVGGATALSLVLATSGAPTARIRGDQVALVLFAAAGSAAIVAAADLLVLFAGLA